MSPAILTQTTSKVRTSIVYEYSFSLINTTDNDIQDNLTAAFTFIPTSQFLKSHHQAEIGTALLDRDCYNVCVLSVPEK